MMTLPRLLNLIDKFLKLKKIREDARIRYRVIFVIFSRWYAAEGYPTNALQSYDEYLKNMSINIVLRVESRIIVEEFLAWLKKWTISEVEVK